MAPFGQSPLCTDTGKHRCRHYWERMSHQASVFFPILLQMVSEPQISVPELSFFFLKSAWIIAWIFFFFFVPFSKKNGLFTCTLSKWLLQIWSFQHPWWKFTFFLLLIWGWGENGSNNLWLSFAQSMSTCRDLCSYYLAVTVLIMEGKEEKGNNFVDKNLSLELGSWLRWWSISQGFELDPLNEFWASEKPCLNK